MRPSRKPKAGPFSPWQAWHQERKDAWWKSQGIYVLLHLKRGKCPARGSADPLNIGVVYIGSTTQSLRGRLNAFHRTAFEGANHHCAGETYRELIGDKGKNLYVAAMAVEYGHPKIRDVFIKYIERKLIWEYVRRNERLPDCNKE